MFPVAVRRAVIYERMAARRDLDRTALDSQSSVHKSDLIIERDVALAVEHLILIYAVDTETRVRL